MTEGTSDWLEPGWSPKLFSSWLPEQFPWCQIAPG
jgi:hypothetical protein